MADVGSDGGGEHGGKHAKKGRKKGGGNPRVDMTPMVDLAFLLLTFFVLTSNLNKAKTMEMAVPKDNIKKEETTKIANELAYTLLIDGNKEGKYYVYNGKFDTIPAPTLEEFTIDPKKGIRQYMLSKNTKVNGEMKYLRTVYKGGKFSQQDYGKIKGILDQKAQIDPEHRDSIVEKRKREDYGKALARMDKDVLRNEMSDTTYRLISSNIKNDDKAPFFIVKWGGDAKYNDVINIIDELKISDISKYALTKISRPELQALSGKTGIKYPELLLPDPAALPETP
ncbi:MAG: biopolymer transporter ExbD [Bacteroidota bacterium]|nr:biopolymer transporter ExbD [Bacteroidota bacterium]